jgi:hypothetical protein
VSEAAATESQRIPESERLVSLKTLAQGFEVDRASVRRWLQEAGIRAVVLGKGRNGAIRYRWRDVQEWIASRQFAD